MLLSAGAFADEREPDAGLGEELCEGDDAILTLAAFRMLGHGTATVAVTDPTHCLRPGGVRGAAAPPGGGVQGGAAASPAGHRQKTLFFLIFPSNPLTPLTPF